MRIGRVVGNVVSNIKDHALSPYKLLIVEYLNPLTMEPEDVREIATDCVCAGIGDIVVVDTDGGAGNMIHGDDQVMTDRICCAIVESYNCHEHTVRTRHGGESL